MLQVIDHAVFFFLLGEVQQIVLNLCSASQRHLALVWRLFA